VRRAGTGIAFYQGAIFAEVNDRIMRYAVATNAIVPSGKGEVIVSGLPITGDHPMHPFIIDAKGSLFVDVGTVYQRVRGEESRAELAGPSALHGEGDPRRHLALRCE